MRPRTPGYTGIVTIMGAVIGIGILMSAVSGMCEHWLPIGLALIVSLGAVKSINR